jgi:hypothetical protein
MLVLFCRNKKDNLQLYFCGYGEPACRQAGLEDALTNNIIYVLCYCNKKFE